MLLLVKTAGLCFATKCTGFTCQKTFAEKNCSISSKSLSLIDKKSLIKNRRVRLGHRERVWLEQPKTINQITARATVFFSFQHFPGIEIELGMSKGGFGNEKLTIPVGSIKRKSETKSRLYRAQTEPLDKNNLECTQ